MRETYLLRTPARAIIANDGDLLVTRLSPGTTVYSDEGEDRGDGLIVVQFGHTRALVNRADLVLSSEESAVVAASA